MLGYARNGEFAALALVALDRLPGVDTVRHLVIEKRLEPRSPLLRRLRERTPELQVRLAAAAEAPLLARVFPAKERDYEAHPGGDEGRYAERFARGHECLLVMSAGSPVAMSWLEFGDAGPAEEAFHVEFPEASCWGYDTFVLPQHRQKGAFAVLAYEMFEALRSRGLTRVLASVDYFNAASRAAHARLGYDVAAVVDRIEVGRRRFVRIEVRPGRVSWARGGHDLRATLPASWAAATPSGSWPTLS
jgi:GNAT superfamily N-acetyltransferase